MLDRLLVEVDVLSVFPIIDWKKERKKQTIFFDIKCHDSYLMKFLQNNITKNDKICWHLYLPHLVSNVKATSTQCYT